MLLLLLLGVTRPLGLSGVFLPLLLLNGELHPFLGDGEVTEMLRRKSLLVVLCSIGEESSLESKLSWVFRWLAM
jgi:hypothetical protein